MAEDEITAEFFQATGNNLNLTQHPIGTAALGQQEQDGCLYHGRQLYILQGPQVFCQCHHVPAPKSSNCWMMQYLIT